MTVTPTGTPIPITALATSVANLITALSYDGVNIGTANATPADTGATDTFNNALAGRVKKSGDTVSGALNLTGTGTGLAVTNNATVGGTLSVTGTGAITGSISGGAAITLGTTGANVNRMILTPGATGVSPTYATGGPSSDTNVSIIYRSKGTGAHNFFSDTAVLAPVTVGRLVNGNAAALAWSGTANSTTAPNGATFKHALTGSVSGGQQRYVDIAALDETVTMTSGAFSLLGIDHRTGSGATGNRWMIDASSTVNVASTDITIGGIRTTAVSSFNQGGTALDANSNGALWGSNFVVQALSGATFLRGVTGMEIDVQVASGASALDKIGLQIVQLTGDIGQGFRDDAALSFNNQAGPGWDTIIGIGRSIGTFPCNSGTTIIGALPNTTTSLAPKYQAKYGVDFRLLDFQSAAWSSPGFAIAPGGAAQVGPGALAPASSGLTLDATGQQTTAIAVSTAGTGYAVGDQFWVPSAGVIGKVLTIGAGGSVSTVSILVPGYTQSGAGPTASVATIGGGGVGTLTLNITWTASTTLSLNPSGGPIKTALLTNAVNDAAATTAGVVVGQFYRNGSIVMQRVS